MDEDNVIVITTADRMVVKDEKISIVVMKSDCSEGVDIDVDLFESLFGIKPESRLIVFYKIIKSEIACVIKRLDIGE